jgi:23S rRNA (guanosine2251-2'-O)-methyltransferase
MIIYGKQVSLYVLNLHKDLVKRIYLSKKQVLPKELYLRYKKNIKFIENRVAQQMAKGGNHQGVLVEIEDFKQSNLDDLKRENFLLILDSITDTGNIGAIVRSAYSLGADGIVACGVKSLNFASIARTSSGAIFDLPFVVVPNILDVLNELKQVDFIIYGASMEGKNLENCKFENRKVLVLGSEGDGISKRARSKIDKMVSIEMRRDFNSLNVSVSAGILIYRMRDGFK